MPTYLERYRAGEREQVWAELVALGPAIRQEPLYSEARRVAHEMMLRARYNVAVLVARLQQLDYQFASGVQAAWVVPDLAQRKLLAQIARRRGPFPLVLHMWFALIGNVDLRGAHPRLSAYKGVGGTIETFPTSDPLYLACLPESIDQLWAIDEDVRPRQYAFEIGGDPDLNANWGGQESHIVIPNAAFDAPLETGYYMGDVLLIPYLQQCFDWGGFFDLDSTDGAAIRAQEELAFLTKDLLPI